MQDWYSFKAETKEFYGVDMTVLEVIFLWYMLTIAMGWNTLAARGGVSGGATF